MTHNNQQRLRVGVSSLFLQPTRNGGTETYFRELISELDKREDIDFIIYTSGCNHETFTDLKRIKTHRTAVSGRNRAIRILYEQIILPLISKWHKCNVIFYPGYLSPLFSPIPIVVGVPDTQYRDIPSMVGFARTFIYRLIIPRAIKVAKSVLTISNFSKQQIVKHEKVNADNITVAAIAPKSLVVPKADQGVRANYLLTVSSSFPHKNRVRLIKAFIAAKEKFGFPHILKIVGGRPSNEERFLADASSIEFIGYVDDSRLAELYQNADGFIFASLYEGVGLPVLEAMRFGVPVACSNTTALPEIAGDAAVYFNPMDIAEIKEAIGRLLLNDELRKELIKLGNANVMRFSWQSCADITVDVLRFAANS